LRPAFLVDLSTAHSRQNETSRRADVVTFGDNREFLMVRFDDDSDDEFDDDIDDEDVDEDEDEDDDEEDDDQPETWQVSSNGRSR
jgi:hypothetical protein